MHLIIGIVIAAVVALVALFLGIARLKENGAALEHATREMILRLQAIEDRMDHIERTSQEASEKLLALMSASAREERAEIARNFTTQGEMQSRYLREIAGVQKNSLDMLAAQLAELTRSSEGRLESLRETVEKNLRDLQVGNEEKLDKMRAIVDEKLHATLEQRLGAAFSNVSEWLDKVHKGLGEMTSLAGDVGDLRRVLTNVKTRGMWGEVQLGALLQQILHRDQYAENVAVIPGSAERVEFAVRLPGRDDEHAVWLPIDAKFPQEDYLKLVGASEACDAEAVAVHQKALERRVLEEAKKIRDKYIEAPHTTDFGVLFLPVEGLYAEVVRVDGLCERVMRDYRVILSGPTTVAALLNSLQMGFRTLAVEKRSSEVWVLLGQIKAEFGKFGAALEKVQSRIEQAGKELEGAGRRTRAIERRLRGVSEMPSDLLENDLERLIDTEGDTEDAER